MQFICNMYYEGMMSMNTVFFSLSRYRACYLWSAERFVESLRQEFPCSYLYFLFFFLLSFFHAYRGESKIRQKLNLMCCFRKRVYVRMSLIMLYNVYRLYSTMKFHLKGKKDKTRKNDTTVKSDQLYKCGTRDLRPSTQAATTTRRQSFVTADGWRIDSENRSPGKSVCWRHISSVSTSDGTKHYCTKISRNREPKSKIHRNIMKYM